MRNWLRAIAFVLSIAWRADGRRALTVVALTLGTTATFAVLPLGLKRLADAAVASDPSGALLAAGLLTASISVVVFGGWIGTNARQLLQERTNLLIDEQLARLALDIPGIAHVERPDIADRVQLLRQERGLLGQALDAILEALAAGVLYSITIILLARIHPALLALPAFGAAFLVTGRRAERLRQAALETTTVPARQCEHLFDLATSAGTGKEIRIFGLGPELLDRHAGLWRSIDRVQTRAMLQGALLTAAGWLLFTLGYAGALVFVVWLAVRDDATPGDVLMTLALAADVQRYVATAEYLVGWLLGALNAVGRYLWLHDYAASQRMETNALLLPRSIAHGIDVDDLSFRYPGTTTDVLCNVRLHLPAGATIALVGENGAGKTTLVKLLVRLYEPTSGRITVDGVDLREYDLAAWRERCSAAFQDFVRFEVLVREAVGVGDLPRITDAPAVEAAVIGAGAGDLREGLPHALETQLGREWEGGVELSDGQWQKLALARAMMRQRPLLLILDEPTASLDAQAEHDLFERVTAARDAAVHAGAITLLVTHRFSTVQMADLIVVLEGGRITETGSHAELVAAGGLYAELYALQARAYR